MNKRDWYCMFIFGVTSAAITSDVGMSGFTKWVVILALLFIFNGFYFYLKNNET